MKATPVMHAAPVDDGGLVRAARHGDIAGLAVLFEKYRPQLFASALRLVGYSADAEDAVQETFVTALTGLGRLRDPAAVGGWLHAVLRNHCLTELRRRRPQADHEEAERRLHRLVDDDSVERQIENRELRDRVWTALAGLPAAQRAAVVLRYFGSYSSYGELAQILAVPIGTVRSRLADARRKLMGVLVATGHRIDSAAARLAAERDQFYREEFHGLFARGAREAFLTHYAADLRLVTNGGPVLVGRGHLAAEVDEDLAAGVKLRPRRVIASGDLTVIEGVFENPPEDPLHCPPAIALVLFHQRGRTVRLHLHLAPRPPQAG
jgi:RNA polymerase sigma factor (sigma-70 family)